MSNVALSIQDLSKAFTIAHHGGGFGRYRTLHDELVSLPRRLISRLRGSRRATSEIFWALKNVSFDVNAGEVLGIIGSNGAGKSTLLKILNRITEPTTGGVDIYGRVGALLEVGTGFHPELTGRENIFLNGAILGMTRSEIKRRFDEIVAFAEVERFLDTPVKRYSSGMYVRLAFAIAAHLDPEILLIDEVLAVGDAEFQKKCLAKMEDVAAKEGRTVIFVSHNMDAVRHLCSRCILLRQGEIARSGNTSEVVAAYLGGEQEAEYNPVVHFPAKDGDAVIRFAGLFGAKDQPATSFSTGEPVLLKCFFNLQRRIPGLRLSLDVFNFKGELVFYSTISAAEPAISIEEPGEHKVAALIPARLLLPGSYSVTLALHTPKTRMYDRRRHAVGFKIVATVSDKFDGFSGDDLGQVYADVKWQRLDENDLGAPARDPVSMLASG